MSSPDRNEAQIDFSELSILELSLREGALRDELQRISEEFQKRFLATKDEMGELVARGPRLIEREARLPILLFGNLTRRYILDPAMEEPTKEKGPEVVLTIGPHHIGDYEFKLEIKQGRPTDIASVELALARGENHVLNIMVTSGERIVNFLWTNMEIMGTHWGGNDYSRNRAKALEGTLSSLQRFEQLARL